MKKLSYAALLCSCLIAYSGFSQSRYKEDYDAAMKKTTWSKTTYGPQLTGQWTQNGTVLLTINLGKVSWDTYKNSNTVADPQFETVEYFKTPESFVMVVKRSESYGGDPAQACYYAIFVRNLSDSKASFAIMKGVCTSQPGQDEYYHGVGRIVDGIDDNYAGQNGVFFTCNK